MHPNRFHMAAIAFLIIGLAAIGFANTESDLPLTKPPIRFAIIGDRTGSNIAGIYEQVVREVEQMRPDFVMTVGDQIQGYTEDTVSVNAQWDEYFDIVKKLTMPLYITPGNHDITNDKMLPIYEKRVGRPNYSFNVRYCHFVVLDVSRADSSSEIPQAQFDWLAKDLAANKGAAQTLVFFHKPFWYDSVIEGKRDKLHDLFVANGVDAVFNGHFHSYFSAKIDGITYTAVGSSGGVIDAVPSDLDFHFTWVTVDDNGVVIAPIKKGGVKPWDIVKATELHAVDNVNHQGMRFADSAPVTDDLKVPTAIIHLELANINEYTLDDTIRWTIPSGWTVEPPVMPIMIKGKDKTTVSFKVSGNGNLYPVPTVTLNFPYAENKSMAVTKSLLLARPAFAAKADKAPVIDGKLDDKCWSNPANVLFDPDGALSKIEPADFYFAYDSKNLYIATRCKESKMDSIMAKVTKNDGGITGEDCVGFFIQPNQNLDTAYQIYFNPLGTVLDQKIYRGHFGYYFGNRHWDAKYKVKTSKDNDYWYIEAAIPLAQMHIKAAAGQNWGLNFVRKQKRLKASADWQVPVDYDPQTFGVLKLK
jgi:predicted phosphodiesterase